MTDSQATATAPSAAEDSSKSVAAPGSGSYADDFHSASAGSERDEELEGSSSSSISGTTSTASAVDSPAVAYTFRDRAAGRYIRIYVPTVENPYDAWESDDDVASVDDRMSKPAVAAASSYSSSFESGTTSPAPSASSSSTRTLSPSSKTFTTSSYGGRMRGVFMSIEELTTVTEATTARRSHRRQVKEASDEEEVEEDEDNQATQALSPLTVVAEAMESTARVLLDRLRDVRNSPPPEFADAPAKSASSASAAVVPRLTVTRLRVESLRLGGRLLTEAAAAHEHEPRTCLSCREARERLERAAWLKRLASRVRRDTTERRLRDHQPACVMSRQMLNVAANARLVSDWMRTGRVPEMRGILG